eukprot:5561237-Pyramimonas_sp.AAC.1
MKGQPRAFASICGAKAGAHGHRQNQASRRQLPRGEFGLVGADMGGVTVDFAVLSMQFNEC